MAASILASRPTGGEIKEIHFSNGNLYRVGTGVVLTWSNQGLNGSGSNGKTYTVKTSGSVARYVKNPGGLSYTLTLTGHNGFVFFSTDAGRSRGLPVHRTGGAHRWTIRLAIT